MTAGKTLRERVAVHDAGADAYVAATLYERIHRMAALALLSPEELDDPSDESWQALRPSNPDRFHATERAVPLFQAVPLFWAITSSPCGVPPAHERRFPGLTVPSPLRLVVDHDGWYRVVLRWPATGETWSGFVRAEWAEWRVASRGRLAWWMFRWRTFLRRCRTNDAQLRAALSWLWHARNVGWTSASDGVRAALAAKTSRSFAARERP